MTNQEKIAICEAITIIQDGLNALIGIVARDEKPETTTICQCPKHLKNYPCPMPATLPIITEDGVRYLCDYCRRNHYLIEGWI